MAKTTSLIKRAFQNRVNMFRSEVLRISRIIAYIKQFNRLKYTQNQKPIPQDNLDVLQILEALLPEETRDYSKLEMIGGPSNVNADHVGEHIVALIPCAIHRALSSNVRSALESIRSNIFEPSSGISDTSSGEISDDSPPQQVPQEDLPTEDVGEPSTKKQRKI